MRILGIDPGYATFGLGLLKDGVAVRALTVATDASLPFEERFGCIVDELERFLDANPVDGVAMEIQRGAQTGTQRVGGTSANATRVIEVVGAVRLICRRRGLPLLESQPATGRAMMGIDLSATDAQVIRAVRAQLKWSGDIKGHAADALVQANVLHRRAFGRVSMLPTVTRPKPPAPPKRRARKKAEVVS